MSDYAMNNCRSRRGCRNGCPPRFGLWVAIFIAMALAVRTGWSQEETPAADANPAAEVAAAEVTTADNSPAPADEPVPAGDAEVEAQAAAEGAIAASDAATGADEPRKLSVPPLGHAQYPEDRPSWVDEAPELEGEMAVWPVKSLLLPSAEEARESVLVQVEGAVAAYAEQVLGEEKAGLLTHHDLEHIVIDSLPAEDVYTGTAKLGDATVYEHAVRLRFDEAYRRRLAANWQEQEVTQRLRLVGVAGGVGLCLLLAGTGLTRRIARKHSTT